MDQAQPDGHDEAEVRPGDHHGFEDTRPSNPNSTGGHGLAGDMGVSSERPGPRASEARLGGGGIEGMGSKGSSVERTDGGLDTAPTAWDAVDVSQSDVHPNRDVDLDDTEGVMDPRAGVDRTVGEPRPNPIEDEPNRRSP